LPAEQAVLTKRMNVYSAVIIHHVWQVELVAMNFVSFPLQTILVVLKAVNLGFYVLERIVVKV
jgi:hypothetical protein